MRAALHAHILVFFKPREERKDFKPLGAIPRVVPGLEPKQRPRDSEVPEIKEKQEDNVYQKHYVGQITAEMVRPDVSGKNWGEYDIEKLRIAGLARAVQMRLPYLHCCNPVYCLKDKPSCRFFFPWPYQPYTCFCENTQRVAMMRRCPEDDAYVVPHNLYLTMFSPSSVNVLAFDPLQGADHARRLILLHFILHSAGGSKRHASELAMIFKNNLQGLCNKICEQAREMVFLRDSGRWFEELAQSADGWSVHGIQSSSRLSRCALHSPMCLRPCMLHREEGI